MQQRMVWMFVVACGWTATVSAQEDAGDSVQGEPAEAVAVPAVETTEAPDGADEPEATEAQAGEGEPSPEAEAAEPPMAVEAETASSTEPEAAVASVDAVAQASPAPEPDHGEAAADEADAQDAQDEQPEPQTSGECLLGRLCLGPVVTLGVINPLGFGVHARYGDYLGIGVDYQFLPTISFEGTSAGWSLVSLDARFYPFGGSFWIGGGFSYQSFSASTTSDLADIALAGSVGIPAFRLGLGFMGKNGFVLGIDLGVAIPLGGTDLSFDDPTGSGIGDLEEVQRMQSDLNDAADMAVRLIPFIPQVNLLRIGYLF